MEINRLFLRKPEIPSFAGKNVKPEKKEDISFSEPENNVTLSPEIFKSEPPSVENSKEEIPEKKTKEDLSFNVDHGILKGTKIQGNRNLTSLTIFEESSPCNNNSVNGKFPILPVPDTRQSTDYSCGASALQAVLMYWGDEYMESELMKLLGTTTDGTHPKSIVKVAKELGYDAEIRENLTLEDLEKSIKNGIPVIVDGQAWRDGDDLNKPWSEVWESGHYMVVTGLDDKNVYIEDPSILGGMGYMSREEFVERWHDYETDKKYYQLGIFISGEKPSPPPPLLHID